MTERQKSRRGSGPSVLAASVALSSIVAAAGLPVSAWAQDAGAPPASPESAPPVAPEGQPVPDAAAQPANPPVEAPAPAPQPETPPVPPEIRFNFKDAPFDQVLDVFGRQAGLPIIRETAVPQSTMTFIGAGSYSLDEGLSILNLYLEPAGVRVRREADFLYLSKMDDAFRKPGDVVNGAVPPEMAPDKIITLTIPLSNAKADLVAQQIQPLVGPYGKVTPVAAQNMIVLVETADQCRRIQQIVSAIDQVRDVDSSFRLFPLKYAKADAVNEALKGLLGERTRQVFIDKDGRQTVAMDVTVSGLNLQPDPRTNSIIAVGAETRIKTVEDMIKLLDVPEGGQSGVEMMTFALESITPDEAAQQINSLFANVAPTRKPTVLPLVSTGKLTIIGESGFLAQAAGLLGQIDPTSGPAGAPREAQPERVAKVLALRFTTPATVQAIADRLMTPRQKGTVRFAPRPDGKGLVVTGPGADVQAFEDLVAGIDVAPDVDKEVRLVTIGSGDPAAVLARAQDLYAQTGQAQTGPVGATLDVESRTVTLIGGRDAIGRFSEMLRSVETSAVVNTETRTYALTKARPGVVATKLPRLARAMLTPDDGSAYHEPSVQPLDELGKLIVKAEPSQFAVVEELVKQLDEPEPGGRQFRVVRVSGEDPKAVADRAMKLYQDQTAGMPDDQAGPVSVDVDAATGNLLLTASPGGMRQFTDLLTQVQQLIPPQRSTRMIDVKYASAKDILPRVQELLASADPIDPSRTIPAPGFQVIERTNSILVTAEDAQHRVIQDFVSRLDQLEPTTLPPLKLLQLRTAEASSIAAMLTEQYNKRPQADRVAKPVEVRADAATNTLIVSAHADLFDEIKSFVDDLNKDKQEGPERVTQSFPLKVARAENVAAAMEKLYPQPPMPVDRLGRPQPWLQKPKEVTVSADPTSNTLIIDAPADRMESIQALAEKLDRAELPPVAELRTYRIVGGNLGAIAQTLQGLRGQLAAPAQPGKPSVQVVIETEPKSQTLIVAGDQTTFTQVERILKDLSAVPVEKGLRVVPVANVPAAEVKDRALSIYNAQITAIPDATPAEVTVDESSNSLMVVADQAGMDRFMKIIDELQRQAGPAREVRMIELKYAKATEVVAFLDDLVKSSKTFTIKGGTDPVFEPIEATNSVLAAAQPAQFMVIEALVKGLDNQRTTELPPMRILQLRTTDAPNLASVLQRSYDRRPAEQRAKLPVDVQADPATNTLIVSAAPEVLPEIEQIVAELNESQGTDAEGREIRIFPLKIARAEDLARTIDEMYPEPPMPVDRLGRPQPQLRGTKEVFVRADRGTNSLIVDAPAKRLSGFEQIVRSLDQQKPAVSVELRTYRVARADLNSVATTLKNLAASNSLYETPKDGQPVEAAGLRAPVTVDTEPASRTLIISGPSAVFPAVEAVLAKLDAADARPETGLKMYALKHARAERLKPMLQQILTTRLKEQQQRDGTFVAEVQSLLDVAADGATNTLIISAPESIQNIAGELIIALDSEAAEVGRAVIRVVPLTFADSAQVSQSLNELLPTVQLPSGGTVKIMSAGGANALLLSGAEADLKKVEEMVTSLDVRPSDADALTVETFAVKNSDAAVIGPMVQRLLADQQQTDPRIILEQMRRARGQLPAKPPVRVEAEPRTNSLIVSGPAATVQLAKTIIERLDQPGDATDRTVMTFTPAKSDPTALAATVQKIVNATTPQGRRALELTVEPKSGAIVAIGSQEQVAAAVRTLAEFDDRAMSLPTVDMQVVDLKNADASAVAPMVQSMLSDRARWPEELRAAERAGLGVAQPTVNADPKANRLMLSVPSPLAPVAKELIASLDQPKSQGAVEVRLFRLTKGDSAGAAAAISAALAASVQPGEAKPVVTAEPMSNSVIVAASAARLQQASELVQSMDQATQADGRGVRTIYLKHARAESVAAVLEAVLKKDSVIGLMAPWQVGQYLAQNGNAVGDSVKIAPEKRLNAVVVSAPIGVLDLAEQVVTQLDVEAAGAGGERSIRVMTLSNADATELAANIQAVFADEKTGDEPPTVRVDKQSNSLIVRASDAQMKTVEELAGKLDSATLTTGQQMRMISVDKSRADAAMIAEALRRLVEDRGGAKVRVISVEDLLKGEEKPKPDGSAEPPRVPMPGVHPAGMPHRAIEAWLTLVVGALDQPADPPKQDNGPQPTGEVTIAVDPATNSLIVVGSPRMTDRLAELAAMLEKQMPAEPAQVQVVTLPEAADAAAIKQVLDETVRQVGRTGPGNPGGFTGPVSVSPDPQGGALIVWANQTDFETIRQVIASVVQLRASTELTVKVYPLSMVQADSAVRAITDLFTLRPRGAQARRVRELDLTIKGDKAAASGTIDPTQIRVTADPSNTSVIVAAPAAAMPLIDTFIGLIDQSPVADRLAIRRYELKNARAVDLSKTLQALFDAQRQGPGGENTPRAQFVADERTNAILVTGADAQHKEVERLLETADSEQQDTDLELALITLQSASPTTVQRIVEQVVVGRDPAKKERVQISAEDDSNLLAVRAPKEQIEQIRTIVAQIDRAEVGGLPVRPIKLERADAQTVATAIQKFFQDRATVSARPGQKVTNRVAIVGDRQSGTLMVAASDEDFAQVQSLASTFDSPAKAREMQYRIIPLQNARVSDIEETIQSIASELQWERTGFGWGNRQQDNNEDKLFVQTNDRTNSVVVMGQGETLDTVLKIISELDRPQAEQTRLVVRAVTVSGGDLNAMAGMIRQVTATPGWQRWRGADPDGVEVQIDQARRLLILIGKAPRVEQAASYLDQIKTAAARPDHAFESIALRHAQADRAAASLTKFFAARAQAKGLPADDVSVIGSADGNLIIASADPESMGLLRDLVAQIDQPEAGADRRREVYILKNAKPAELADALRSQFPRTNHPESQVLVTPQPSTNSIIVSAAGEDFEAVDALVKQLDTTMIGDVRMSTVNLKAAKAGEVATALKAALPPTVTITVTPVERNNSVLLTGSEEAIRIATEQISRIDTQPEKSAVEFRRTPLKNAIASTVVDTLRELVKSRPKVGSDPAPSIEFSTPDNAVIYSGTSDQIHDIEQIIQTLDVPADVDRATEFVRLDFADAEQLAKALQVFYGRSAAEARTPGAKNVTIVADPSSNSLIISANKSEWDGIRALLTKLDTQDYDTSTQLAVIPLMKADATSVAAAINQGFRAPMDQRVRQQQTQQDRMRQQYGPQYRDPYYVDPNFLVETATQPTVSAEPQTNSLIVFAPAKEMERIQAIVKQLDILDFPRYADAQVIPLETGKASQVAESVRQAFASVPGRSSGPRAILIVGDDASNSLIVRADEPNMTQIRALIKSLEDRGDVARANVRILPVVNVPAARLQKTIAAAFADMAKARNEALTVEISRDTNALVVSSSQAIFDEIEKVVKELDSALPPAPEGALPSDGGTGLGPGVFIIDVQNNSPADVAKMLEQLGVTKAQPSDRPGVVGEPVTLVPMTTRRALAVVAGPKDGQIITSLVRSLDSAPANAEQSVQTVALKTNGASAVVATLKELLSSAGQTNDSAPAKAIAEQLRRLSISRGAGQEGLTLDLSVPVRLIADETTNSVMIASTPGNVAAAAELVKSLDTLPVGDAVVMRMFPLENASATRLRPIIKDLFAQGEALRRLPGTKRQGLPTTATGQALAGEVAVSVDDRTNSLIVAGREEALALVEVLVKSLDSDEISNWVEPTIIRLQYADATRLAATLTKVLADGQSTSAEAERLQQQIARIRIVQAGKDPTDPSAKLEADLFAPMTSLLIQAEESLNALIVVSTPANARVVGELVKLLDVEAAGADNVVRLFPLEHAAADRVAGIVSDIFKDREQSGAMRAEDRLVIRPDLRTNTLVVSTSPRSFAILEGILKSLDQAKTNQTVGLHVIPVPGNDATQLAPKIQTLMAERIAAATRAGELKTAEDTFSIQAEPANNVLIVACSDENLLIVQDLISALGKGDGTGGTLTDVVPVGQQQVEEVAKNIQTLYVDKENQRRGDGSVSVIPNERLNALIVSGTQADVDAIRKLVERLGSTEVTAVRQLERIELRSANAIEIVNLLESVLAGQPVSGRRDLSGQPATKLQYLRDQLAAEVQQGAARPMTEAEIDGVIRDQVTLTPDLRTNSVFVNAPAEISAMIRDIIMDLDGSGAGERRVAQFQLKNADARQMADVLRDMFNLRQQGDQFVLLPTRRAPDDQNPDQDKDKTGGVRDITLTPVPDERQQLAITVDPRTNTLLVSGTQEYIDDVTKVVTELDAIVATERERFIYRLKNADAQTVQDTLVKYFQSEADRLRQTLGPDMGGSAAGLLEREVTVVGDTKSNTVLVSASPRQIEFVRDMIQELDAAPPQVLIQVMLAEVTIDSGSEWGVDMKLKDFGGDMYTAAALAAGSGVATALGVPNLTFSSSDFEFLVRALEAQGKLEVLSRPQIIANNNEPAFFQAGDNIAFTDNVELLQDGSTRSTISRKDLGIKLTVTPSISSDGFVKMDVQPEISTLTAQTTQISENFDAPVISSRKVSTVVTVKDGQTVVLGGLLQTLSQEHKTKVPIIGDIPFIGIPFRSTSTKTVKTELLVILTPKVVPGESDEAIKRLKRLTDEEINRMTPAEKLRAEFEGGGDFIKGTRLPDEKAVPPEAQTPVAGAPR